MRSGIRRFAGLALWLGALAGPAVGIAYLGAVSYQEDRGRVAARIANHAAAAATVAAALADEVEGAVGMVGDALGDGLSKAGAHRSVALSPEVLKALVGLGDRGAMWAHAFVIDADGALLYPRSLSELRADPAARTLRDRGDAPRTCPERGFDACVREIRARRKRAGQLASARRLERFACADAASPCAEGGRKRAQARAQFAQLIAHDDTAAEALLGLARLARGDGELAAAAGFYDELARRFGSLRDEDEVRFGLWAAVGGLEVSPTAEAAISLYARALDLGEVMPSPLRALIIERCQKAITALDLDEGARRALAGLDQAHRQLVLESGRAAQLALDLDEVARAAGPSLRGRASAAEPASQLVFRRLEDGRVIGLAVPRPVLELLASAVPVELEGVKGPWAARLVPSGLALDAEGLRVLSTSSIGEALPTVGLALVQDREQPDPLDEIVRSRSRRHLALTGALAAVLLFGVAATVRGASRARELARLKSDFVSTVSHELKTPLTSIRMFAEMLQEGVAGADEERRARYQSIIVKESERLGLLIANLLDYAQIERGTRRYAPTREDLDEVASEAVEAFARLRDGQGAEVVVERGPRGSRLEASLDREVVVQAILNLLSNAVKYGGDGKVVVTLAEQGARATVAVSDRGPGIPVAEQGKIFREFYRAPAAQASAIEGTGLGLALVKRHTEALGGEVSVSSRPGHGATFTLSFPRSQA